MTPQGILDRLLALFPDFGAEWNSSENCFREHGGSFTRCGVFMEFSHYFRERYEQLPKQRVAEVAAFVIECMDSPDKELGDAAATCFLENVASEQCSADFKRYLDGEALQYFSAWDVLRRLPKRVAKRSGQ